MLALAAVVAAPAPAGASQAAAVEALPDGIEVVLDASGSMRGLVGERERMEVARELLDVLRRALAEGGEPAPLALRVYGADQHRLRRDCTDTRLVLEADGGGPAWVEALAAIAPLGVSPLAHALERAAADDATTYVLVTDGGDNCGGDPCATWRDVVGSGGNRRARLHVVALAPEPTDVEGLRCLSRVGSGSFTLLRDPDSTAAVASRLALVLRNRGLVDVRLSVGDGERFAVPVRLLRPLTGELVAAFAARGPQAVPAGIYRLVVETTPPVTIDRVMVLPGRTTTVERTDFGRLTVDLLAGDASRRAPVSVRAGRGGAEVRFLRTGEEALLRAGRYQVRVDVGDSLIVRDDVAVRAGETTRVVLGAVGTGTLTILAPDFEEPPPTRAIVRGPGGIDTLAVGRPSRLPVGTYRLVVQTLPPYVTEDVRVEPDREATVALPETGVLGVDLVGPDGPIRGVSVEVAEPTTDETYGSIASGARRLVMPGTYRLVVGSAPPTTIENVSVTPGQSRIVERRGFSTIGLAAGARDTLGRLRLEVLGQADGRPLASAAGLAPVIPVRPGTYRVRLWRDATVVWSGRVSVASGESARIDWVGP